jgi:hypothetical protein
LKERLKFINKYKFFSVIQFIRRKLTILLTVLRCQKFTKGQSGFVLTREPQTRELNTYKNNKNLNKNNKIEFLFQ